MKKQILALLTLASASLAHAHEGHGMPGASHWHATDIAWLLAVVAAVGLWLARRK